MGILSSIGSFLAHPFGLGEDDEDKKKKQQQPAAPKPAAVSVAPSGGQNQGQNLQVQPAPDNGLNLNTPAAQLKKAVPAPNPTPQQNAAQIGSQAGYGPNAAPAGSLVKAVRPSPPPIEVPKVNMPLETAKQAVGGIGSSLVKVGDSVLGGVSHLGKVISYPILTKEYSDMAKKGQISNEQAGGLIDQAGNDAGFKASDKGGTVLRKAAGAVAGPTAAILTAGLAPEVLGGESLAVQTARGAAAGAGAGAGFGGINALQEDNLNAGTAAKDIGEGAATGAVFGAVAPTAANLLRKALPGKGAVPGVNSVNPNQEAEAAAVAQAQAQKQAAEAQAHALAIAKDSQAGSPLDKPTYQRNQPLLPAGTDRSTMGVPIDPNTPEGNVLLNQGKPQVQPTGVEIRPGFPDRVQGVLDPTNSRMIAGDTVPGQPSVPVATPGRNLVDIGAPRASADPELLQKARDTALRRATGQENVIPTPNVVQPTSTVDALVRRAQNPTGTNGELVDMLNQIITHPGADSPTKEWAMAQREQLVGGGAPAPAPGPTIPTPDVRTAEAAPVPNTPAAVTPEAPVADPLAPPVEPAPGPAQPLQTSGETPPAPSVQPGPSTAPAAPNLRQAILKDLGDNGQTVGKLAPDREALVLADLRTKAANAVRQVDPNALADSYLVPAEQVSSLIRTPQDYALGRAALDVLYKTAREGDEAAKAKATAAVSNIVDAMNLGASGSAQLMRVAQESFDSMPVPMKISKVVSQIQKLNSAKFGADSPEADFSDPAKRAAIEARFNEVFERDQQLREHIAGQDAIIAKGTTDPASVTKDDLHVAGMVKQGLEEKLSLNSNKFAKIYADETPGQGALDKAADFQRTAMLSAPTGRASDVLTTGANILHTAPAQALEGATGRVLNAGRSLMGRAPGKYVDRGMSASSLVKAVPGAFKKTYRDFKGTADPGEISKLVKGQTGGTRSDIGGVGGNAAKRLVKAGVNFATHISEGVKDSEVARLSRQEGLKQGFTGDDLKKFTIARSYTPSADVAAKSQLAHEVINNLNDNPVTSAMRDIGSIAEKRFGKAGKFIKNAVLPFPTWVGGQMYNSITDKNVVANAIKAGIALKKGDPQAVVSQLSKAGLGVAELYGLGYVLSKTGVITNKDANGDDYEGAYVHIPGTTRSFPVTTLGFFAPNILLGNAAYNAFEGDNKGKNFVEDLGKTALNTVSSAYKALSAGQLLGADNSLGKTAQDAFGPNGAPEKAINAVEAFGSQFVPTLGRDVNAVLDNNTSLNPTHEASDTTVNKPNGNKDYIGTALNKAKDLVPGLSQSLPRKADQAARDLIDRTLRGNRDTPGGVATKAAAKTEADRTKDFKARDVPDPKVKNFDDAVEARVESGDYDKAVEGLQAKLDDQSKDKDIPASKNKAISDQIKALTVAKNGKFDPGVIDQYKKTSLSEWRDMGDPDSDNYDQKTYETLFNYDKALADAGVSRNTTKQTDPLYSAKTAKSGSGSSKELSTIKSNTIGSTPEFAKVSLSGLAPQKAGSVKMPTIQQIKPGELIKARKITVSKGQG